jgi:P-type conjugative transfer protein TrbJ
MKRILLLIALAIASPAKADTVFCVNCGTEWTQLVNYAQLASQYAKQVEQYALQLQQYQAQLQNMRLNPASVMGTEVTSLINSVGSIMQSGKAIGGTMAQIDANFANKFNNPLAGTFSQNFKTWTSTSQDTLGAAMRAAGLHRDAYATDTAALQALYNKTQTSQGSVAALQTLGEITVMQVQQTQKLQDLISTQNLAANTWMASQEAKQQATVDNDEAIKNGFMAVKPNTLPKLDTSTRTYKKLNLYNHN